MTTTPPPPRDSGTRHEPRRTGAVGRAQNLIFALLRIVTRSAHSVRTALGVLLLAGIVVALAGSLAFAWVADLVRDGYTQAFDDAVLRWVGAHRTPGVVTAFGEITFLGTGIVVMMMVVVAALFLSITKHRYSALLLLATTAGGLILNSVLKLFFSRPRPQVIEWGTHAMTSSFPSGHAMSAAIVYGTVAYLAARLHPSRWVRRTTMGVAVVVILLICSSRVYLGVHYPSDVLAGVLVGSAWAAFCMVALEAFQKFAVNRAPDVARAETPAPPREGEAPGEIHQVAAAIAAEDAAATAATAVSRPSGETR